MKGIDVRVDLPGSKSLTNRALIASAAAGGGRIVAPSDCDDTRVLSTALAAAGWNVSWEHDIEIGRRAVPGERIALHLGDSGTGVRLVLGLLAASPGRSVVDGSARLRDRPLAPLLHTLFDLGARLECTHDRLPVGIDGTVLEGGRASIRPEVSSQFVSSILLAAPLMRRGIELEVVGDLPSAPYLDLTTAVLRAFGADIAVDDARRRWRVAPGSLRPTDFSVEADWSAAAFFICGAALAGGTVDIGPLDALSLQGDREILPMLVEAGLRVGWNDDRLLVRGPITAPITADLTNCPDLFPALVAVAACVPPGSRFSGLDHLVHKESDRLGVMVENLGRLGAECVIEGDRLEVRHGLETRVGAPRDVTAAGDHRIAMAMAVAALGAGPLHLDDGECASKSFPAFWEDWHRLIDSVSG
jgi:3-phosphoshikimate 1-carboxyvinyltransferase